MKRRYRKVRDDERCAIAGDATGVTRPTQRNANARQFGRAGSPLHADRVDANPAERAVCFASGFLDFARNDSKINCVSEFQFGSDSSMLFV